MKLKCLKHENWLAEFLPRFLQSWIQKHIYQFLFSGGCTGDLSFPPPWPRMSLASGPWIGTGTVRHHTSSQSLISATQLFSRPLESSEYIELSGRAGSFDSFVRCCYQVPGPLASCSLSKKHFSRRPPCYESQAGFSHCLLTKACQERRIGTIFSPSWQYSHADCRVIVFMYFCTGMTLSWLPSHGARTGPGSCALTRLSTNTSGCIKTIPVVPLQLPFALAMLRDREFRWKAPACVQPPFFAH